MIKNMKYHHSVSELGNIQVRMITEYQDDNGNVLDKKYSDPVTPADTKDMTGWDQKSQDIVEAITKPETKAAFETEMQTKTGKGLEEIITHDRVIDEDGRIAVRRITRIFDEGVEVSKKYHRSWVMPTDDPTKADVISKAVAQKLHTAEVKQAYQDKLAAQALDQEPIILDEPATK